MNWIERKIRGTLKNPREVELIIRECRVFFLQLTCYDSMKTLLLLKVLDKNSSVNIVRISGNCSSIFQSRRVVL